MEQNYKKLYFKTSDLIQIPCGDIRLCPYDFGWFTQVPDAQLLSMLANTDRIRKYLPGLDFSSEEKAQKTLEGLVMRPELQLGFTYMIRQENIPIGMINIDTPLYNSKATGIAIWTIDFFLLPQFEHQHIMYASMLRILDLLKTKIGVNKIYALVDTSNAECLNLVGKGLFMEVDNTHFKNKEVGGYKPKVFELELIKIKFE